jgi:hypothetical protein
LFYFSSNAKLYSSIFIAGRIGGGVLMTDIKEFSDKVQKLEEIKKQDDEVLNIEAIYCT